MLEHPFTGKQKKAGAGGGEGYFVMGEPKSEVKCRKPLGLNFLRGHVRERKRIGGGYRSAQRDPSR